jgi:hypothetical protein
MYWVIGRVGSVKDYGNWSSGISSVYFKRLRMGLNVVETEVIGYWDNVKYGVMLILTWRW